jgi:hypothetical protein
VSLSEELAAKATECDAAASAAASTEAALTAREAAALARGRADAEASASAALEELEASSARGAAEQRRQHEAALRAQQQAHASALAASEQVAGGRLHPAPGPFWLRCTCATPVLVKKLKVGTPPGRSCGVPDRSCSSSKRLRVMPGRAWRSSMRRRSPPSRRCGVRCVLFGVRCD